MVRKPDSRGYIKCLRMEILPGRRNFWLPWTVRQDSTALCCWDGEESEKLVKKTFNSKYPLRIEDGWIGVVIDDRSAVKRLNLDDGSEVELLVPMKNLDGVWSSGDYTLLVNAAGKSVAVRQDF